MRLFFFYVMYITHLFFLIHLCTSYIQSLSVLFPFSQITISVRHNILMFPNQEYAFPSIIIHRSIAKTLPASDHFRYISSGFFVDKCHPIAIARFARFFAAYLVAMSTYKLLCSVFTYVFFHASSNLHFVPRKITPSKICSW